MPPVKGRPRQTNEEIAESARRFTRRGDWHAADGRAYQTARHRGIFDAVTSHMSDGRQEKSVKYTDEAITEAAAACRTRQEFRSRYPSEWYAAQWRGLMDTVCSHMRPPANPFKAEFQVYAYEFTDKSAYIGLTIQPDIRHGDQHVSRGPVFEHTKIAGQPQLKIVEQKLLAKQAVELELTTIRRYEADGWTMLNSAKGGSLGALPSSVRLVLGDNRTVHVVIGAPGSGKSELCKSLQFGVFYVSFDEMVKRKSYGGLKSCLATASRQDAPIVFDPTIGTSTIVRDNCDKYQFVLWAISETDDVLKSRLEERGGSFTDSISRRNRRIKAIFNSAAAGGLPAEPAFIGTADEVLAALKERLCLV